MKLFIFRHYLATVQMRGLDYRERYLSQCLNVFIECLVSPLNVLLPHSIVILSSIVLHLRIPMDILDLVGMYLQANLHIVKTA